MPSALPTKHGSTFASQGVEVSSERLRLTAGLDASMTTSIRCALSWVRASVGALRWRVNCHRAARIAGQSLAGGEKAQRRRGGLVRCWEALAGGRA